jgi:Zn-dependent protease/CBS domain-containing protein
VIRDQYVGSPITDHIYHFDVYADSILLAHDIISEHINHMSWSLPIVRIAGIQLRIHITFLLLIAWLAFGYYAQGGSAAAASRVIFVLLLFLCVVLHEFGHAFAAKAFGINTPDITLLPIGGVARLERMPEEPVQELIIAVAGPLVNVVIAIGLFVAGGSQALLNPSTVEGGGLVAQLLTINIILVLFNLLPAFPMDGGRVLRALLATRMSYARATQVAATVGQGFAFIFGFLGLLWNPFLIFIALFVYIGASQEAALAQMKDVSRRFPVSSAMVREFRTLSEDATLEEAVDALLATSQHDFPVVDETGSVAGLLTRHDLIAALRKNDPALRVGDVMRRDIPTVTTGTRFEDAFRIMQECNCPAVPVLDRMKRLVGLLTPENVTELMMVQSAMPQRRVL